jgi:hypothetical protein
MATIAAFFDSERETKHVLQQLALETTIESITYVTNAVGVEQAKWGGCGHTDTLSAQGFTGEQFRSCLHALDAGKTAVIIQCNDAADMLVALQAYGVKEYYMV